MTFRPWSSVGRLIRWAANAALLSSRDVRAAEAIEGRFAAMPERERAEMPEEDNFPGQEAPSEDCPPKKNIVESLEFDSEFYLAENSDVREAGIDPLAHYLADGRREGRPPNASVKRRAYTMDMEDLVTIDHVEKRHAIHDKEFFVSIITPTYNTDRTMLRQLHFTILNQIYDNWEWIVVDDGSVNVSTRAYLAELASSDARINVLYSEKNGGISVASNIAIQNARGTHVALVDHDDLLPRRALSSIYNSWRFDRNADMFYTDECKLMPDGTLDWFWGKPDWSPAYLENTMYLGHLIAYRTEFIRNLGGFRSEFDGTQDYDLALRAALCNPSVCHVPEFGYIWRAFEGSTALDVNEKHYTLERQRRAVAAYAAARNPNAEILEGDAPGYWRLRYPEPKATPLLTYIIYDAGWHRGDDLRPDAVADCVRALIETGFYTHARFVVLTSSRLDHDTASLQQIVGGPIELVRSEPTDGSLYETSNSVGLRSGCNYLCIISSDMLAITKGGGAEIVSYMHNTQNVGVMSPVILENERIWQNGTIKLRSGIGRSGANHDRSFGGPNNLLRCRRETLSGSDGFVFISGKAFRRMGGFDTSLPRIICELELCARMRRAGLSCLVDPFVEVSRHGQLERSGSLWEAEGPAISGKLRDLNDPYFSKWYDQTRTDFQIRLNRFGA